MIYFGDVLHIVRCHVRHMGHRARLHMVHRGFSPLRNRVRGSSAAMVQEKSYQTVRSKPRSTYLTLYGSQTLAAGWFYIRVVPQVTEQIRGKCQAMSFRRCDPLELRPPPSTARLPLLPPPNGCRTSKPLFDGIRSTAATEHTGKQFPCEIRRPMHVRTTRYLDT